MRRESFKFWDLVPLIFETLGYFLPLQMSFAELDVSGFTSLLDELLHGDNGSITREKIVVLFFFCSDLAIHHLKASMMDLFERCISWSLQFIVKHVCGWVQKHGGWVSVQGNLRAEWSLLPGGSCWDRYPGTLSFSQVTSLGAMWWGTFQ